MDNGNLNFTFDICSGSNDYLLDLHLVTATTTLEKHHPCYHSVNLSYLLIWLSQSCVGAEMMLHCWADYIETLGGIDSENFREEYASRCEITEYEDSVLDQMSMTCMLESGHPGPHEWTSDSEIIIEFK